MSDVSIPPLSQPGVGSSEPDATQSLPGNGSSRAAAPAATESQLPTAPIQSSAVAGGDQCPSCGSLLVADQRYCLECGQRRGDPRLPFMDAVILMEAVKQPQQAAPPPPKKKRSGISPNAALIAGVGTLLLALGIGVLIGRSGNHSTASTTPAAPIVIHGGGGSEEGATASSKSGATTGGGGASNAKTKKQKEAALKAAEKHPAAEEVLKPTAGVKLPPAKTQVGGKCEEGTAGCENGKFEGNFFK